MKSIYYTFLVVAFAFVSCRKNTEEPTKADPRLITPQQAAAAMQMQSGAQPVPAPQQHNLFHENNSVSTPSMASGSNPAHGQPNHRCDIPVGAPLNTPANGAARTTTQSTQKQIQPQVQTIPQSITAKTVTPKGMNPPHGEKGHRCDIAVGAPLNSKPAATVPATTTATSGEVNKKFTVEQPLPALLSTSSANKETPEGMNPPHGQEGHRCDIAVGAALPKS